MTDQTTQAAVDPSAAGALSVASMIDVPTLASFGEKTNAALAELDAISTHTGYSKALSGARAQLVTALLFVETHFERLEAKAAALVNADEKLIKDLFHSAETSVKDEVAKVGATVDEPLTATDAAATTAAVSAAE